MNFTVFAAVAWPRAHQFYQVMKLTTLLLVIALVQASAAGFAQRISLRENNAPFAKVLADIEAQSGYTFLYTDQSLNDQKVTVHVEDANIEETLIACFKELNIDYKIVDKNVLLKFKDPNLFDKTKAFFTQTTVTGRVTDELGQSLPGVTVTIKGTQQATATDSRGTFVITIPDDNTILVFSSIGYEPQELTAKDIAPGLVVKLKASETNLQEVVINKGYYNEKRGLSTGDVSVVSAKTIQQQPVSDPIQALIGRVPGLNIQQTSGIPGAYATIRVRGQNSIANGNDPLYIIDGIQFSSLSLSSTNIPSGPLGYGNFNSNLGGAGASPFNALNPADIESIEILKDADATAIYGSRGANGVILITTKKGKAGATRVDMDVNSGIGKVTRMMDLLNTQQYLEMRREAFKNDGLPIPSIKIDPTNTDYDVNGVWDTTRYTNWQKLLIGNAAHFTNAQASISGGTSNTQFMLSGSYSSQGTVYPGNFSDQKASAHIGLNHTSPNGRFSAQFTANYVNDSNSLPIGDFTSFILNAPDAPPLYEKDGNINWQPYNGSTTYYNNPISYALQNANLGSANLIGNLILSYQIIRGLTFQSKIGYNHQQLNQNVLSPASISGAPPYNISTIYSYNQFATTDFSAWNIEPQANYQKKLGKGNLNILLGVTFQKNEISSLSQEADGFSSDALITNPAVASTKVIKGTNYTLYKYNAIYSRIGYDWEEKYLINLTARRDGSSRFGPGKQFGNFGAVGAGWIFSKEHFMQNHLPFLSFGKLRASYGTSGNDQIPDYQFLSTYSVSSPTYQGITGLMPSRLTNPYFAWEVVRKLEGGLDLGFWDDRINFSISYFRNRTNNQLVGIAEPRLTGFTTLQYNLPAILQNTGVELELSTVNVKHKRFNWSTNFTFTLPNNKLVAFPNIANFPAYQYRYAIGKSIFIRELYHNTGVNPQTGLYSFDTGNSNGQPTSPQDLVITQPITQKYYGGFQNTFSYKQFNLDLFFQFVKQTGYSYANYFSGGAAGFFNYNEPTEALLRWRVLGDKTSVQRFTTIYGNTFNSLTNYLSSDANITDASFIRLKNVALSYQVPQKLATKVGLKNVRTYIQAQNLLTFTKYVGLDPETRGALPPLRMITIGLSVGL